MKDPRREYEAALADFSQPGGRWNAKGRLTYWGKAAGMSAEEIISDARAAGVKDRDADIRRGWNDAKPKGDHPQGGWRHYAPRAKPEPSPTFPRYVRDLIRDGGGEAHARDLIDLSPVPIPTDSRAQTMLFLRSLFDPGDILFSTRKVTLADGTETALAAKPGDTMRTCAEWLAFLERGGRPPGDILKPNALTGKPDTDGKLATIGCLAKLDFAVLEFDDMPLRTQAAFWRGLLAKSPLAPMAAAIVFSGGKSLHGLLRIECATLAEWRETCAKLRGFFCTDPTDAWTDAQGMKHHPYQADPAGLKNPTQGVRLPGVRRFSNGRFQQLLYLHADAPCAPSTRARETPPHKPADAPMHNHAPKARERATGAEIGLLRDCAPMPPADDAPFDELLAYAEVLDAWRAAQ